MRKTFDYRQRAEECAKWAADAANEEARKLWREMESYWRKRGGDPHFEERQRTMTGLMSELEKGPRLPVSTPHA